MDSNEHRAWLRAHRAELLAFGAAGGTSATGFPWLDRLGRGDPTHDSELWICCRMTHVHALGAVLGVPGSRALAEHGVRSLLGAFRDHRHGGWFAAVHPDGTPPTDPAETRKTAYEHAFVLLAGATARGAGVAGGVELFERALEEFLTHFWDEAAGMVVEDWNRDFSRLDGYRGVNANMHAVEALLAAADVADDDSLRAMALRIVSRVVGALAPAHDWRIPEHFDESWTPNLDYNADQPAHPFRPYGATVGHWLEWSRLTLQLRTRLEPPVPDWMTANAQALYDAAVREGWHADGSPGFVYTVDWQGAPVVRQRMHWVAAEAISAAATLHAVTGDDAYARDYERWWDHAVTTFVDIEHGSWHHEVAPDGSPSYLTWRGKPDLYHAVTATLVPLSPLASSSIDAAHRVVEVGDPASSSSLPEPTAPAAATR